MGYGCMTSSPVEKKKTFLFDFVKKKRILLLACFQRTASGEVLLGKKATSVNGKIFFFFIDLVIIFHFFQCFL